VVLNAAELAEIQEALAAIHVEGARYPAALMDIAGR
jgi:hypothetical protein